jgi:hypothetical protein
MLEEHLWEEAPWELPAQGRKRPFAANRHKRHKNKSGINYERAFRSVRPLPSSWERKRPLPFKGRDRVRMGFLQQPLHPIPLLSSPLKGEGRADWHFS